MQSIYYRLCRFLNLAIIVSIAACQQDLADAGTQNIIPFLFTTAPLNGTANYLMGSMVLENAGVQYTIRGSGTFTLPTGLREGDAVQVSIASQPAGQTCSLQNAIGTATESGYSALQVDCGALSFKSTYTGPDISPVGLVGTIGPAITCPVFINTGLAGLNFNLEMAADVLITLSTHLTFDTDGTDSSMRLLVNGSSVAQARVDKFWGGQYFSVTFVTIQSLAAGNYSIDTDFCNSGGGKPVIKGAEKTVMTATALQSINGLLGFHNASFSTASATNITSYTNIGFSDASFDFSEAVNYITTFTALDITRNNNSIEVGLQRNGLTYVDSYMNDSELMDIRPLTILGAAPVAMGPQLFTPVWKSSNASTTLTVGNLGPAYFSVLALDASRPFGLDTANNVALGTTNLAAYNDVPDMTSISLTLAAPARVMLMLQANQSRHHSSGRYRFAINVDGGNVIESVGQASGANLYSPISAITIESLSAGTHIIKARWAAESGTASIGAGPGKVMLVAFAIE